MRNKYLPLTAAALGFTSLVGAPAANAELSGSVAVDWNSHFISYGFDVWGAGDSTGKSTFNPVVSIDYTINDSWTFSTGFWQDINDNATPGIETVETDIWAGLTYTTGITSISATFQNWQYAGTSEEVLDISVAVDTFLSPSLTWHERLGAGASGGFEGSFLVLAGEYGFDVSECFSVAIPASVGYAVDDFHTTDTGYGFASIGLQGSYAIYEGTSLNFGVTYWDTDAGVTGNADNSFVSYNLGVSYDF